MVSCVTVLYKTFYYKGIKINKNIFLYFESCRNHKLCIRVRKIKEKICFRFHFCSHLLFCQFEWNWWNIRYRISSDRFEYTFLNNNTPHRDQKLNYLVGTPVYGRSKTVSNISTHWFDHGHKVVYFCPDIKVRRSKPYRFIQDELILLSI